jgi:hypothetical protein
MASTGVNIGVSKPIITGHPDGLLATIDLYMGSYISRVRLVLKVLIAATAKATFLYPFYKASSLYSAIDKYIDPVDYELDKANLEIRELLFQEVMRSHKFKNKTGNLERSITKFALSNKTVGIDINETRAPYAKKVLKNDPFLDNAVKKIQPQISQIYLNHIEKAMAYEIDKGPITEIGKYIIEGTLVDAFIGGGLTAIGIRK